ncbi:uncharacterized protein [Halyomorpha halys]|uniref:uncharacterized protein isoform X2 n=1 Tax=Halyomorpha halys TaxID=286706 RepID=UPI0006D51A05|nr:uncharacterized protein LOC106677914 isoform X2 [Halyomorpha halys]
MRIDLLASLLLFGLTVEGGGIIRPKECYTCQSTLESNICGEGNIFPNFMTKYCTVNQFYCIKVIEKAQRDHLAKLDNPKYENPPLEFTFLWGSEK